MKVYFNKKQLEHKIDKISYNGNTVLYHETPERALVILKKLKDNNFEIYNSKDIDFKLLQQIHNNLYLDYLYETQYTDSPFCVDTFPDDPRLKLRIMSIKNHGGAFAYDSTTGIMDKTFESALASASTAYEAAKCVGEGKDNVAYGLCRPPGHHAASMRFGGFCYINNAAFAAQYLLECDLKPLIVDIDDHHGSGTQSIFYDRSDVFTFSIHADPHIEYPYFSGYEDEIGIDEGKGYNKNIIFEKNTTFEKWFSLLVKNLNPTVKSFKPTCLVISIGCDTEKGDVEGGEVEENSLNFKKIGQYFSHLNLPTVIIQEGGYDIKNLADNVYQFLSGFDIKE